MYRRSNSGSKVATAIVQSTASHVSLTNVAKGIAFSFRLGPKYFLKLLAAYFLGPMMVPMLGCYAMANRRHKSVVERFTIRKDMNYWKDRKKEVLDVGKRGYSIGIDEIGLQDKSLKLLKEILQKQLEVVIADVDQDGGLVSRFGDIEGLPTVSKNDFLPKTRFLVEVCACGNTVVVKKQYGNDKRGFLNELIALHELTLAGCDVPGIRDVDFDKLEISSSFIKGYNLQEILAQHGALIRDRDLKKDKHAMSGTSEDRLRLYWEEGRRTLSRAVDGQVIDKLYLLVRKVHRSGIRLYDIKWGNVIVQDTTDKPFLVDFDSARRYSNNKSKTFTIERDRDIEKLNFHLNANKLTYRRIKDRIAKNDVPGIEKLYAPVYFGYGLRIGNLLDVNVGYGRWHFILKDCLLPLDSRRVLSLGANCAFNEIQMLRYGAKEVIGFEIDEQWVSQGLFFKEAFEWADNDSYNFKYIKEDMAKLPSMDLGKFDMVIALCSLYYLSDEDMLRVEYKTRRA